MLGAGWGALDVGSVCRSGWVCPGQGRSWRPACPRQDPALRSSWNQPSRSGPPEPLRSAGARRRLRTGARPAAPAAAPLRPGNARVPPPINRGARNRWHSSTSPAASACPASSGPPIEMSRSVVPFISPHGLRIELPLDPRPLARDRLQRPRVDDLVGRPPDLGEVAYHVRLAGRLHRLPRHHHLVHAPPVEVRPDRPLQIVDERVQLLVRCQPVELPLLVGDVAVERCDRGIDQARHAQAWIVTGPPSGTIRSSSRSAGRGTRMQPRLAYRPMLLG